MKLIDRLRRDFPDLDVIPQRCIIAGGAVRDALLDRPSADLDLACSDPPEAARAFASRTGGKRVTLGTRFQTERVIVRSVTYDFSPIQGESIEVDLARRDFTINAIALRPDGSLIDPFDGRRDLANRIVRMVAEANLAEDPLRVLRAARMSGMFGFRLDPHTADAAANLSGSVTTVAPERITGELRLVLGARHGRRGGEEMRRLELDSHLLGFELTPHHLDRWEKLQRKTSDDEERLILVLSMLLAEQEDARAPVLDRWNWKRDELRSIRDILEILDSTRLKNDLLELTAAERGRLATDRAERIARAVERNESAKRLDAILTADPFDIEPLLDGHDIARLTGARGEEIGRLKRRLWEAQVLGDVSTRDDAIEYLRGQS